MSKMFGLLFVAFAGLATCHPGAVGRRDQVPTMPYDANTSPYCTWWFDNDGSVPCTDMPDAWAITFATFRRWNPSITEQCGGFVTGKSYCVEAFNEPTPPPEPTEATTTTAAPPPATTTPSSGVSTPLPIQPDMVANCNAFHFVVKDENCATIAAKHSISTAQFVSWNPSVGADCRGLWLSVNVCVSIIGLAPPSTTPTRTTLQTTPSTTTTTTTRPAGGISTPSPAQPGMISNCVQFHFVVKGDTCASLAQKYNINVATFLNYNTQAGNDCRNLWLEAYACVKVAGQPTALPTPVNTAVGCAAYYTQIGGSILSFVNTCPKTR